MFPATLPSLGLDSETSQLQALEDATTYFLHAMPHLAQIIPVMDHLEAKLATFSVDVTRLPAIHAAVRLAKQTLNQYYQATDWSETYCIAMGVCDSCSNTMLLSDFPSMWCLSFI